MATMTTTTQKKNTMMPGMAYPAIALVLATAVSYPPTPVSFDADVQGTFFILIRPVWPECHKMATVRRVAAETQEAPGK